jgi:hypothetical protein
MCVTALRAHFEKLAVSSDWSRILSFLSKLALLLKSWNVGNMKLQTPQNSQSTFCRIVDIMQHKGAFTVAAWCVCVCVCVRE